jgi:SAM-dependent methyltransferase
MAARFQPLLACPACGCTLGLDWCCPACNARYTAPGGIPDLRLPGGERTETVRAFYAEAPFPGYPPHASLEWLRARAGRSRFARLLDAAISPDAHIVEIGCGTGQMSLFLARADRLVVGADLTRESLSLAASAAERFGTRNILFVETDLARPGLRRNAFDVVYCSGALHHTPDPRAAFAEIVGLAKPGGIIVVGLYNAIARLPLRLRRAVARITGYRWIPFDPVLSERDPEPERRQAWLRDQYRHPEEHRHSLGEVRRWFAENHVQYLRAFPTALLGEEDEEEEEAGLFADQSEDWWLESTLAQIGWIRSLGAEGGLFVAVGRRALPPR